MVHILTPLKYWAMQTLGPFSYFIFTAIPSVFFAVWGVKWSMYEIDVESIISHTQFYGLTGLNPIVDTICLVDLEFLMAFPILCTFFSSPKTPQGYCFVWVVAATFASVSSFPSMDICSLTFISGFTRVLFYSFQFFSLSFVQQVVYSTAPEAALAFESVPSVRLQVLLHSNSFRCWCSKSLNFRFFRAQPSMCSSRHCIVWGWVILPG